MRLIIDIGNTFVKYALFKNDKIIKIFKKSEGDFKFINETISKNKVNSTIVSSVRKQIDWKIKSKFIELNYKTKLPIKIILGLHSIEQNLFLGVDIIFILSLEIHF